MSFEEEPMVEFQTDIPSSVNQDVILVNGEEFVRKSLCLDKERTKKAKEDFIKKVSEGYYDGSQLSDALEDFGKELNL